MLRAALLALLLTATQAYAGATYRMAGAQCTDSNHNLTNGYDAETVVGPKLCSNKIDVQLRMSDAYTPGTFFEMDYEHRQVMGESYSYADGEKSDGTDFTFETAGEIIGFSGQLPVRFGATYLSQNWLEGAGLFTFPDGTWWSYVEFGGGPEGQGGRCAPGSVEGAVGSGGQCIHTRHYYAEGTYTGWQRVVPEPGTLALLALGLAFIFGGRMELSRCRLRL